MTTSGWVRVGTCLNRQGARVASLETSSIKRAELLLLHPQQRRGAGSPQSGGLFIFT